MNRRNRFWIAFASAAITFGSLMYFVGPKRHFAHGGFRDGYERCDGWHGHHHHDCCDHQGEPARDSLK